MSLPFFVRLNTSEHGENHPTDTLAKRVVASNLEHMANSHGQVLVNWTAADGDGVQRTSVSGGMAMWQSAEFPLKMRSDGSPFRWRVRLRGRRVNAGANVTFFVRVGDTFARSDVAGYETSATSSSWLSPLVDGLISLNADDGFAMRKSIASPQSLGAAPIAFPEAMARVHIYCSAGSSSQVELTGLHVTEFVGA